MNAPERAPLQAAAPLAGLAAPWCDLDDAALLAHFRGPRGPRFFAVADPDETHPEKIAAVLDHHFTFNGETHHLPAPLDWLTNPSADVEWHILLHKGYYLVGLAEHYARSGERRYLDTWMALIDGWIAQVPPGFIANDVTGRRVQNWIYSYYHAVATCPHDGVDPAFHRRMLESLAVQVDHLCEHLTPKRNHRTLELVAIWLAALVFPEMRRADFWRAFALERLVDNIRTDLLPDGVQIELSTDYHQLVVKNYLNVRRLATLNDVPFPAEADAALNRALDFCLHSHKPDGGVPSFSDGDARSFLDVLGLGAALYRRDDLLFAATAGAEGTAPAHRVAHFPHAGYTLVRDGWGAAGRLDAHAHFLCFDCGPLGEGNHGHFDALSIELAANGRSLVVDPGRYTYSEAGPVNWRIHFRGTAAHNTVCVDGRNQTRYEPRPVEAGTRHGDGAIRHKVRGPGPDTCLHELVEAEGWAYLYGSARSHEYDAIHRRRIIAVSGHYWLVLDDLDAPTSHDYALRFQLNEIATGATRRLAGRPGQWLSPGLMIAQPADLADHQRLEDAWVSYRYGEKHPAPRLRTILAGRQARFATLLRPFKGTPPDVHIERLATGQFPQVASALAIVDEEQGTRDLWCTTDETTPLALPGGHFTGRWLWLRTDRVGRPLRALGDRAGRLTWDGRTIPLENPS